MNDCSRCFIFVFNDSNQMKGVIGISKADFTIKSKYWFSGLELLGYTAFSNPKS